MHSLKALATAMIVHISAGNLTEWCKQIDSTAGSTKYHMSVPVAKVCNRIDTSSCQLRVRPTTFVGDDLSTYGIDVNVYSVLLCPKSLLLKGLCVEQVAQA